MKRRFMNKSRSLTNVNRRRNLLKRAQRKLNMRRHDFHIQVEFEEFAKAS